MARKKKCVTCDVLQKQNDFLQNMVNKLVAFQCPEARSGDVSNDVAGNPLQKYESYIAAITGVSDETGVTDDEMELGNRQ